MTHVELTHEEMTQKVQLVYALSTILERGVPTRAGCFEWTGALNSRGYGVISVGGKRELTHRVSYEAHVGPIPDGMTIDHLCMNKKCVHPDHLEVVTDAENKRRAVAARAASRQLAVQGAAGPSPAAATPRVVVGDTPGAPAGGDR